MNKKAIFGIFLSVIIFASFVLAQVPLSPSATKYNTAGMNKEQLQAVEEASSDELVRITDSIYESADENFDHDASNAIYKKYDNTPAYNAYMAAWQRGWDEKNRCGETCVVKANVDRKEGTGDWEYARRCGAECTRIREEADLKAYRAYVEIAIQNNNNMIAEMSALAKQSASGVAVGKKEDIPAGPVFNTNSDRGRDTFGTFNPSMGGYLGDAYVTRSDGTKVIPGKELYLKVDDKVITGKESKVNIIFGSAGKMQLGPDTQLRVGSALLDQYYLAKGSLKTNIKWADNQRLDIFTPNAGISMKGTEFVIDYNETTNTTTVFLNEGVLEVNSSTDTIDLTAGNYCRIGPDGAIVAGQLKSDSWNSLGDIFLDDEDMKIESGHQAVKSYAYSTLAVMIISAIICGWIMHRAKGKQRNKEDAKKNSGTLSIILGLLGIIAALFPIIGFPLSSASLTLARIQKIRNPTTSAKIGLVLGILGVLVNGMVCFLLLIYVSK